MDKNFLIKTLIIRCEKKSSYRSLKRENNTEEEKEEIPFLVIWHSSFQALANISCFLETQQPQP